MKLLRAPFYGEFIKFCAESTNSIKLCSPYVKKNIVNDIISKKNNNSNLELITSVKLNILHQKSSDIEALQVVLRNSYKIFSASKLHAKVYIFDEKICAITSANLTKSGLKENIEYGIVLDDKKIIRSIIDDFNNICASELSCEIKLSHLEKIDSILNNIEKFNVPKLPNINFIYDKEIFCGDNRSISDKLSGWDKDLFLLLSELEQQSFITSDFCLLYDRLSSKYPNNKNIEANIRQTLQHLRDYGLIEFVERGVYKKLWS